MANLNWYVNRLRAMSALEVAWRLEQRHLQKHERKVFEATQQRVDEAVFEKPLLKLGADWSKLPLNLQNRQYATDRIITLLGSYNYDEYYSHWHAGFQTEGDWPFEFSYDLRYKQRDDIGDARTNWELNRGFQFALLAKNAFATNEVSFLVELEELFESWCVANPFLWGISWVSVMEVAIRCINWMYAAAFLAASEGERAKNLARQFEVGALNMASYVANHYSRYSSANNHAIVEACALGLAGFAYGYEPWLIIARDVLEAEVLRQNHTDGVNREQSLHYQAFFMEAVALYMLACLRNKVKIPLEWKPLLAKMCDYVQDCRVAPGVWLEFGDNDEGILLNLCGVKPDVCEYVLQLMGVVLKGMVRWSDYGAPCESLCWLVEEQSIVAAQMRNLRENVKSITYLDGGVSILRSRDGRVVFGLDHGPLGFGAIAAHGHADALSVQLYVDGVCIIGDPGTYIYHSNIQYRNEFRSTSVHSTVCVKDSDQSEMLGAFMWGKRAVCKLIRAEKGPDGSYVVEASHDGYTPAIHVRKVTYDGDRAITIEDKVYGGGYANAVFVLPPEIKIEINGTTVTLVRSGEAVVGILLPKTPSVEPVSYSTSYGVLSKGMRICVPLTMDKNGNLVLRTELTIDAVGQ